MGKSIPGKSRKVKRTLVCSSDKKASVNIRKLGNDNFTDATHGI